MPDINKETGLPHTVALGDVLSEIELSPADASVLLTSLAQPFLGGAQHGLGTTLRDKGMRIADPLTYQPDAPDPDADRAEFERWRAQKSLEKRDDATRYDPSDPQRYQHPPAAQGQSTTPGTLATDYSSPSQAQATAIPGQPVVSPGRPAASDTPPTPPMMQPAASPPADAGNAPGNPNQPPAQGVGSTPDNAPATPGSGVGNAANAPVGETTAP